MFEHPAVSRRQSDCGGKNEFLFFRTTVVPVAPLRRAGLRISPQRPTHSNLRLERCATGSVKTSPFCDPARLPSKGTFLRPTSCDACRAPRGVDLVSRACPAFVGFAANAPSTTPLHRDDPALLSQTWWSRLGPRAHPYRIDVDASLGQTQPFDFCNEFSKYDTRARTPRALSSPAAGVGPTVVATHDALLTLLSSSSFGCKEDSSSMRRSELRVIPRRLASRAKPESPRALLPRATPFKWARRTWETRRPKERSKSKRGVILRCAPDPTRLAPCGLFSWLSRAPFVASDACETGWRPVRVLVHVRIVSQGIRSDCRPAKGSAFPNTSGAFHRWNRMAEGIAPWTTRQDLLDTRP
jgi:hypothetical protein